MLHGHELAVNTVAASPDGSRLYTADAGGTVKVWDLQAVDPARSVWRLPKAAYSLALDPGEKRAAMATWEGWVRVVDLADGAERRSWRGHEISGVDAAWSPDGRWIATTGNDGRVVLWNAATGALVKELQDLDGQIVSVAFSPDSSLVAAPGGGGAVRVWRVPSGDVVATLKDGTAAASAVAWSQDGTLRRRAARTERCACGTRAGPLRTTIDPGAAGTPVVAFDRTGARLAIAVGRTLRIWDPRAGRWLRDLPSRSGSVLSLSYSADGSRLAAGLSSNAFEVWDAATGDIMLRLPYTGQGTFVAWTRSQELILGPLDGTVRILRAAPSTPPAGGKGR